MPETGHRFCFKTSDLTLRKSFAGRHYATAVWKLSCGPTLQPFVLQYLAPPEAQLCIRGDLPEAIKAPKQHGCPFLTRAARSAF
jgi:hypothetical protein